MVSGNTCHQFELSRVIAQRNPTSEGLFDAFAGVRCTQAFDARCIQQIGKTFAQDLEIDIDQRCAGHLDRHRLARITVHFKFHIDAALHVRLAESTIAGP